MNKVEQLKAKIEEERRTLDEMLAGKTMEEVLLQSRKVDTLIEEYIDLTN